jgi:hypothetical protein
MTQNMPPDVGWFMAMKVITGWGTPDPRETPTEWCSNDIEHNLIKWDVNILDYVEEHLHNKWELLNITESGTKSGRRYSWHLRTSNSEPWTPGCDWEYCGRCDGIGISGGEECNYCFSTGKVNYS